MDRNGNPLHRILLVVALFCAGFVALAKTQGLTTLLSTGGFMPHGHCYLWLPSMVWLQVISNSVIGTSYVVISSLLVFFVWRRKDLPFDWMFLAFGLFIVACGVGHFIDILTLWRPMYWLAGVEKGLTAFVSVLTAILLVPFLPKALALPSPADLRHSNTQLQAEIVERKQTEAKLAQQTQELENALGRLKDQQEALLRTEKLAAVGQLAASVAHELRNPLAAIRSASAYISKRLYTVPSTTSTSTDPRIRQFFDIIERELVSSSKIITDLLDFARERALELQPCPLHLLAEEAIGLLPKGSVQIENRIPDTLPMPSVDREQFRQVLVNLIQNAVDATTEDTDHAVIISAEGGDSSPWKIMITDRGCGIPAIVLGKIFEPLFTTKTKGTGLGLAIVHNIVKSHQGQISVQSEEGLGSTFTITLPALPPGSTSGMRGAAS